MQKKYYKKYYICELIQDNGRNRLKISWFKD